MSFAAKRSFSFDRSVQDDEITRLLSQRGNSGKIVTVPKKVGSFQDQKVRSGVNDTDGKILRRTMIQRSRFEVYGLKTLSSGETCTSMSATRHVNFEM